jgi:predicted regulator of Ras-like GTPase activity (Roadblock/LC7/MglB family)
MANGRTHGERLVRLETDIVAMKKSHEKFEQEIHDMAKDVRQVRDAILEGKGGWKIAAALFGLAGAIVASLITAWLTTALRITK